MKTLFLSLLLIANPAIFQFPDLIAVRQLFLKSGDDEASFIRLQHLLENFNENNHPVLGAYRAAASMMMAGFLINPFSKLSSFREGSALLEKCLQADSLNTEMHYLRFAMQSEAPSFLGYRDHLSADKNFILANLKQVKENDLKQMILSLLNHSAYLTTEEKIKLNHE